MTGKSGKNAKAEACEAELAEAKAKAEEYLDTARRLQADFDNFRKRSQKESEDFRKYANENLIRSLLTTVDDLHRALSNSKERTELSEGVTNIEHNLTKTLGEYGVSEIPTDGKFDPSLHEALCVSDGDEDDLIAEVFQKGYRMHDRVIRYAKVRVTRKAEGTEVKAEQE
jgi:molecular chaperone GrpE